MLLKEEELQRLIKEECIKVISEGLPSVFRRAITGVFGDADPRAARLIQGLEQSPGILDMPADELRSTFKAMEIDKADEVADAIISARRAPTEIPGELIDVSGEVIGTVQNALVRTSRGGVRLNPEQTRQMLTIVRNGDNLPTRQVADSLADAIPSFNPRTALAALAAIGVVTGGGKIAWDNFGKGTIAAPRVPSSSGDGTSTGKPAPSAGSTGDASWDRYLRGSEYVTADQAKQVYDAWVAFVDSQGLKEQAGGVDKSFASYKAWWRANKSQGNLGRHGGYADTIRYLKSLTKSAAKPKVASPETVKKAQAAMAGTTVTSKIDGKKISLQAELSKLQSELAGLKKDKKVVAKNFEAGKRAAIQTRGDAEAYDRMGQLTTRIKQIDQQLKALEESVINESTYNKWQKLIK